MTKILLLFRSKSMLNSLGERLRFENFSTVEVHDTSEVVSCEDVDIAIAGDNIESPQ